MLVFLSAIAAVGHQQGIDLSAAERPDSLCRFENGRIAEHWGVADRLGQMMQLELLPQGAR